MALVELARLRLGSYVGSNPVPGPRLTEDQAAKVLVLIYPVLGAQACRPEALSLARGVFKLLQRSPNQEELRLMGGALPREE